ncbi:TIGR01841 family phasin [Hoeflea sp. YIM 152468]|uniref:phasin family protein n=1 Tax=Hoeflea sp. YIM 152468 TaxID=3031759 RepID=UPI0023D9A380|nr:TIGR01841 family phasin [Hoeflea sp. YIM 152468]MDF1607809.1 TIGR01841 family phasin [Hoeflea sp. YIM 152468]
MTRKNTTEDMVSMFLNFGKDMKLPSPDLEALVARHKKNLEALDTAAKTAGSGASTIATRQREMVQEALDEIMAMAENLKAGGDPQSLMAAQAEFAKRSFEMAIKNTSEIADLAQKSSTEAFNVLQQNMQETLEEARKVMTQTRK